MRPLIALLFVLLSISAQAQESRMKRPQPVPEPGQWQAYLLDLEMRFEKNEAEEYVDRKPLNLGVAYRAAAWSVLFEYSKFNVDTGNAALSVDRTHEELVVWGRWHLWNYKQDRTRISVYGGAGVGAYQEEVKTSLGSSSQTDSTGYKIMAGLSAGGDISYLLTKSFGVIAAIEGRGLAAEDFDPNPTWSAVLRTGVFLSM